MDNYTGFMHGNPRKTPEQTENQKADEAEFTKELIRKMKEAITSKPSKNE